MVDDFAAASGAVALLEAEHLAFAYHGVQAVRDVSLHVGTGEVVALLGANGAGKTTTVKMLAGVLRSGNGRIRFGGEDITGLTSHEIVELGITLIPEGRLVFPQMTVWENLLVGGTARRARARRSANLERVMAIFPRLGERRNQPAGSLSGGEQQMLAIARGMMSNPKLIILDEPSLGLSPILVNEMFQLLAGLQETGTSILLVEQNVFQSLKISGRGYVVEKGHTVLDGPGKDLLSDPFVKQAFLGV